MSVLRKFCSLVRMTIAPAMLFAAVWSTSTAEATPPCSEESIVEAIQHSEIDVLTRCSDDIFPIEFRTSSGESLLHLAATADADVVRFLLNTGVDPHLRTAKGETALHYAARQADDPGVLVALLARGADVGVLFERESGWFRSDRGVSALHIAAERENGVGAVAVLLSAGADPEARDSVGRTPLHYAARTSVSVSVVENLLIAGAAADSRDSEGVTPLHLAAASPTTAADVVARLLAFGADPDAKGPHSQRPLHYAAAYSSSPQVLELLLGAADDACPRNGDDVGVVELAAENEHIHETPIYWQLHEICFE